MFSALKSLARRRFPARLRHAVRKWNSWRQVRDFEEFRWPPAAAARRFIRPGDGVVDAGANIGYVSALFSRWVGSGGRVYSIEPEPGTFDILAANMRRLRAGNVELFQCALGDREAEGVLAIPEYAAGGENLYEAQLVRPGEDWGRARTVGVRVETLDHLLADRVDRLALIKLDVEGGELEAVRGGLRLIRKFRPVLLIEVNGNPWAKGSRAAELFGLMRQEGYRPCRGEAERLLPLKEGVPVGDVFFLPSGHNSLAPQDLGTPSAGGKSP